MLRDISKSSDTLGSIHCLSADEEADFEVPLYFRKAGMRPFTVVMDTDEVPDIVLNYQVDVEPEWVSRPCDF